MQKYDPFANAYKYLDHHTTDNLLSNDIMTELVQATVQSSTRIVAAQGASPRLATFSSERNNETRYYCYQVRRDTINRKSK